MTKRFKAWDKLNKVMHYNFQFIKSGDEGIDWIIFTSDKQTLQNKIDPFKNPYFQQQFKIMPYTGIDDEFCIPLYEDDVVGIGGFYIPNPYNTFKAIIKYDKKHACFYLEDLKDKENIFTFQEIPLDDIKFLYNNYEQ